MFIQRQISANLVDDSTELLAAAQTYYQHADVLPRIILKISGGKYYHQSINLGASVSSVLPLPIAYTSASRLFVLLISTKTIKAVTVSPAHATATVLVRAGANQPGVASFTDFVTSITLTNPQVSSAVVETFIFEYPDLSLASSYQNGAFTLGTKEQ